MGVLPQTAAWRGLASTAGWISRPVMDAQTTIALLAGGIVLAAIASLGAAARTRAPLAWHAYLPWHAAIFTGAAAALFAVVHLYTLARASGL